LQGATELANTAAGARRSKHQFAYVIKRIA